MLQSHPVHTFATSTTAYGKLLWCRLSRNNCDMNALLYWFADTLNFDLLVLFKCLHREAPASDSRRASPPTTPITSLLALLNLQLHNLTTNKAHVAAISQNIELITKRSMPNCT